MVLEKLLALIWRTFRIKNYRWHIIAREIVYEGDVCMLLPSRIAVYQVDSNALRYLRFISLFPVMLIPLGFKKTLEDSPETGECIRNMDREAYKEVQRIFNSPTYKESRK